MSWPILSVVVWLPIAGAILVMLLGSDRAELGKRLALGVSVLTFLASVPLYTSFDVTTAEMQFVEMLPWIRRFDAMYYLGVDGISMPLILLTTFLTPIVVIAGWQVIKVKPAQYFAAFLMMEGLMIGVFAALDALLFYVFWEAMLVPMFIIIGVWGGERRVYATVKFFLYTFLGSVFMLVALIYMYLQAGSYSILAFHDLPLTMTEQTLIFIAFLLAFAVKVPMFPVHTWLPDAHVEAPTGGSVILAAILLKMGGYGFIRFSLPIAPDASQSLAWLMIALSLIAVVYIGFVAIAQHDMKKLIAYSSIAHMGFVTLGFFVVWGTMLSSPTGDGARLALQGGMVQMISHGLISGALFLCVGVHVRPAAQPRDQRLRRRRQHDAEVRGAHGAVRARERRFARHVRVRRRVPRGPRQLPGELLARVLRGHDARARRGLHALDGEASRVRRGCERRRRLTAGRGGPRVLDADGACSGRASSWACGRRR